jgi:hypothetical protein
MMVPVASTTSAGGVIVLIVKRLLAKARRQAKPQPESFEGEIK